MEKTSHDEKVGTYFDKAAVTFDTFYDHKRSALMQWVDRRFRSDVFNRYFATFEALTPLEGKRVLDIGCGSGPYVAEAARRGAAKVVGLDMAEGMLELAQRRVETAGLVDRCQFIHGAFPENAPSETFDYSITMGVMDYVPHPSAFLTALAKRVAVCSVLSFPSKHWFRTPLRKVRYWLKQCPVYFYDRAQLERLAKEAGFSRAKVVKLPGAGMDYFVTLYK
jgi:2-polyprenyl-3-methyl-5-hydroxy-6-metoxy-1,4-benzoquinol methylase